MTFLRWIVMVVLLLFMIAGNGWAGEFYQYTDQNGNLAFTDDMSKVPEDQQPGVETFNAVENDSEPLPPSDEELSDPDEMTEESDLAESSDDALENADDDIKEETQDFDTPAEEDNIDFDQDNFEDEMPSEEAFETPEEEDEIFSENLEQSIGESPEDGAASDKISQTLQEDITPAKLDARKAELDESMDKLREEQKILSNKSPETMKSDQLTAYEEQVKELNSRIQEHKVEIGRFQRDVAGFNKRIKRLQLKEREKQKRADEEMGIYSDNDN